MVKNPKGSDPEKSAPLTPLCALDDIEGSTGIVAEVAGVRRAFMVIRRDDAAFVYVNSCPHIGSPLDFRPGQFLNLERTHILCSTHGALFRIEDGYCISGPCAGDRLEAAEAIVEDGMVYLIG